MIDLKVIQNFLNLQKDQLRDFKVAELYIFGSVAKNTNHESSDLDVLVTFAEPIGMFHFSKFKFFLEDNLKIKVDLATKNSLHPYLKEQIINEAIRVA